MIMARIGSFAAIPCPEGPMAEAGGDDVSPPSLTDS